MKTIAVFFADEGKMSYPFNKDEYWHAYRELNHEITQAGANFFIVRLQSTYLGNGIFSKSWRFSDKGLVEYGQIKADAIYDKGSFITDQKVPVLNNEKINEICTDKWNTYQLFSQYCPQTFIIKNENEFYSSLDKINSEKKVIKPIDGEEGREVYIGDNIFLKKCPKKYPILLQEFLDSSSGIKGIVSGIHDFRIAIMNGEIVYSFVRTPPNNSLVANVALGGNQVNVDIENIPQEAMNLVVNVDRQLAKYGDRFYGIDLALSSSGFKIIELNSRLGLDENSRDPIFNIFKKKLAKLLLKISTNTK